MNALSILQVTTAPAAPNYRRVLVCHHGREYVLRCFYADGLWEVMADCDARGSMMTLDITLAPIDVTTAELIAALSPGDLALLEPEPMTLQVGIMDRYTRFCADVNAGVVR